MPGGLKGLSANLLLGTALMSALATNASAQNTAATETVVVTGTSIRGAAPTGSNLITVDRANIEATGAQTTQELLTYVPQVNINFGSSGQAIEGGGGNISGPTLHSLGNQSANATLILIDGHRIPPSGQTTAVVDPSIIPASALQRVEVLPDGASSIYGADALAGVINFITRRNFTGWESSVQYGAADSYNSFDVGQLWGTNWTGGSILVAYNYSSKSHLMNSDRDFITARQDIRRGADATSSMFTALPSAAPTGSMTTTPAAGQGTTGPFGVTIPYPSTGSNLQNFFCPIATVAAVNTNNTNPAYLYPYSGGPISVTQTAPNQGVCDTLAVQTSLPSQTRNSIILSVSQAVTPNITASLDLIYGSVAGNSINSRGTILANVFGPTGSSAALGTASRNPFYVGNTATGTASETIRYSFDNLLGPGATTHDGASNMVGVLGLTWDMGSDWESTFDVDLGRSAAPETVYGALCGPCAFLALNGTTNATGAANTTAATSVTPDSNGLGTIIGVTRPLTTANALDVWNPAGSTNRTSAATLASLIDSNTYSNGVITMQEFTAKVDGPLLDLWAGPLKVAVGVDYEKQGLDRITTGGSAVGGASGFSSVTLRDGVVRSNYSAFAEFLLPVVAESAGIPLINKLDLDISGRFDHFSGFGDTENPKVGVNWSPVDGITTHASYGTSFMAPEIISLGGGLGSIQTGGIANNTVIPFNSTLPYSSDPTTFGGGGIAGTFVTDAGKCAAAGSNPVNSAGNTVLASDPSAVACKISSTNSPGLQIRGTVPNLGPQTGLSYSAGMDIDAGKLIDALDGLNISATYYNTKFMGYITNQQVNATVPQTNALAPPGGWTPTSPVIQAIVAGRALNSVLPAVIWSVVQNQVRNAFTLWQEGIDFDIRYRLNTDNLGAFTIDLSGNQIIRFAQGSATVTPVSIVDGINGGRQTGIEMTEVTSIGWRLNPFQAQLQIQYAHPYSVVNGSFPYNLGQPGIFGTAGYGTGGYQHIGPLYNANLHLTYNLPEEWMSGAQASLNINNVLDTKPPFADTTSGAGGGNQIGRQILIGFKKSF
jgi:iron complex outermembrane receptor protein